MPAPTIVALMLMGARPEPYLKAVLHSLEQAADFLIVHDNSGAPRSQNRNVLERSTLHANGRVGVVEAPFVNFSQARNECLDYMRANLPCDAQTWLLMVDCDEVHGSDLAFITRHILSTLPPEVGIVDTYFYNFILSFNVYNALDRRHNLLVRHNPDLRWTHDVHEHLTGLVGQRICLPYTYHHYGYIRSTGHIIDKWRHYRTLGDQTYSEHTLDEMSRRDLFEREVDRALPYNGSYPEALALLDDAANMVDPDIDDFHRLVDAHLKKPGPRLHALLRDLNYRLRLMWRAVQWFIKRPRDPDARRLLLTTLRGKPGVTLTPQRAV